MEIIFLIITAVLFIIAVVVNILNSGKINRIDETISILESKVESVSENPSGMHRAPQSSSFNSPVSSLNDSSILNRTALKNKVGSGAYKPPTGAVDSIHSGSYRAPNFEDNTNEIENEISVNEEPIKENEHLEKEIEIDNIENEINLEPKPNNNIESKINKPTTITKHEKDLVEDYLGQEVDDVKVEENVVEKNDSNQKLDTEKNTEENLEDDIMDVVDSAEMFDEDDNDNSLDDITVKDKD